MLRIGFVSWCWFLVFDFTLFLGSLKDLGPDAGRADARRRRGGRDQREARQGVVDDADDAVAQQSDDQRLHLRPK